MFIGKAIRTEMYPPAKSAMLSSASSEIISLVLSPIQSYETENSLFWKQRSFRVRRSTMPLYLLSDKEVKKLPFQFFIVQFFLCQSSFYRHSLKGRYQGRMFTLDLFRSERMSSDNIFSEALSSTSRRKANSEKHWPKKSERYLFCREWKLEKKIK